MAKVIGTAGKDILPVTSLPDKIMGLEGNDWILGGAGGDIMNGGTGIDTLIYTTSSVGVTINLLLNPTRGRDAMGDTIAHFENVVGSSNDDTLSGDNNDNRLFGADGNDQLFGLRGNDVLIGGRGSDILNGGEGFDVASYVTADESASINLRSGQVFNAAAGDQFVSIEGLIGTEYGDSLIMGEGNNRIHGGGGDDFLDGGRGNDVLFGGAGADFLHGSEGVDTAAYRGSDAAVQISLANFSSHGGHAEGDVLSWIHNITGSQFGDEIEGDILDNRLRGLEGDDVLLGRGGKNVLVGGDGSDLFGFMSSQDQTWFEHGDEFLLSDFEGGEPDLIVDFTAGEDQIMVNIASFSGGVINTDRIQDLDLDNSGATFAFTGGDLFYVTGFTGDGNVQITHLAHLEGVTTLNPEDLYYVYDEDFF